jgi:chitodextrinase
MIPEGTSVWNSDVYVGKQTGWGESPTYESKSITIKGAGIDKTVITGHDGALKIITEEGKPFRLTGLTFSGPYNYSGGIVSVNGTGKNVRVDHCKFFNVAKGRSLNIVNAYGVIDHCEFIETGAHSNSGFSVNGKYGGDDGSSAWKRLLTLGSEQAVYIEDCYIRFDTAYGNGGGDSYDGARYVFRYNTVINADCGHHGLDSGSRSVFSWEIYENCFTWLGNIQQGVFAMSSRGGTGLMFNNTVLNPQSQGTKKYASTIGLSSYRSKNTMPVRFAICDGSNPVDGNIAIESGTAGGPSSTTNLKCIGKNWASDEWKGYFAWNLSDNNSLALVHGNTKDMITAELFVLKANGLAFNTEASATQMKTTGTNWAPNQWAGYTVINQKDYSRGVITANTADTLTAELSGGTRNYWQKNDIYKIVSFTSENGSDLKWEPGDNFKLANGYPGRDQNGVTTMTLGDAWGPQKVEPIYEWNNTYDGEHRPIIQNNNFAPECYNHIQEGRDYFSNTHRPEYVPYVYPHPLTLSDYPDQQRALELQTTVTASEAQLNWQAVTGAESYRIVRDWNANGAVTVPGTSYTDTMVGDEHIYMVYALDSTGKTLSAEGALAVSGNDTTPPSIPNGLLSTNVKHNSVTLNWWASRDNVGVAGYRVYRDGIEVGTSSSAEYTDTGLSVDTTYSYTVSAYDAKGNIGSQSSPTSVTTFALPDNNAPVISPIGNKAATVGNPLTFTIMATDQDSDLLTYTADGLPAGAAFTASNQTFTWVPTIDQVGSFYITFKVSDGTLSDEETITITVQDEPSPTPTQKPSPTPTKKPSPKPPTSGGSGGSTPDPAKKPTPSITPKPTKAPTQDQKPNGDPASTENLITTDYPEMVRLLELLYEGADIRDNSLNPTYGVMMKREPVITLTAGYQENLRGLAKLTFPDIRGEEWYAQHIPMAVYRKLINGFPDGTFKGGNLISRTEVLTMLARFNNSEEMIKQKAEQDAENWIRLAEQIGNDWYTHYVVAAKDGLVYPDLYTRQTILQPMTRAEVIYALTNSLWKDEIREGGTYYLLAEINETPAFNDTLKTITISNPDAGNDGPKCYLWYKQLMFAVENPENGVPMDFYPSIMCLKDKGILLGNNGDSKWNDPITRAEVLALFERLARVWGEESSSPPD